MDDSQETSKPLEKRRRILDVSEDAQYFNLDIRVSILKTNISKEMVDDLIQAKDSLVNGSGNQVFYAKIRQGESGEDLITIGSDYYYGLE